MGSGGSASAAPIVVEELDPFGTGVDHARVWGLGVTGGDAPDHDQRPVEGLRDRLEPTPLALLALVVCSAAIGAAVALLAVFVVGGDDFDATRYGIGNIDEFPLGTQTLVERDVAYFDPWGSSAGTPEPPETKDRLRIYMSQDGAGVHALLATSPASGCRLITAGDAIASGLRVQRNAVFLDPCHGATFTSDGTELGVATVGNLRRFPVFYGADGTIEVDLTGLR